MQETIYLHHLRQHLDSSCSYSSRGIDHSITLDNILQQSSATTPPTDIEVRAAGHVVKKMLNCSDQLNLPTGGHVSTTKKKRYTKCPVYNLAHFTY